MRVVPELKTPGLMDSDTIRIRVRDRGRLSVRFLAILLHEAAYVSTQIEMTKRGAILSGLNTETISSLALIVPPLREREEIIESLSVRLEDINEITASASTTIALLQERRSALISAAVTGKIDVRNYAKQSTGEAA